jgi:hypothetical protein
VHPPGHEAYPPSRAAPSARPTRSDRATPGAYRSLRAAVPLHGSRAAARPLRCRSASPARGNA